MSSTKYNNKYLDDIAIDLGSIKFNQESIGGYLATPTRSSSSSSTQLAASSSYEPEQENTPPYGSSLAPFNDYNELDRTDIKTARKWTLKQRVSSKSNADDVEEESNEPYPPSPPRIDASWSSFLFGALSAPDPLPPQMRQGILQPTPIRCNTSSTRRTRMTEDTSAMMSLSMSTNYCYSTPERKKTRSNSRIVCPPIRHKSRRTVLDSEL